MWVGSARIVSTAKSAALAACLLLAACAENKPPAPEAQATGGVEPGSTQDFLLNVGDRVFFNENSAELSPTATATLDKQAAWLARFTAYVVNVEGHADEKGGPAKNKKLSVQRADSVRKYLVAKGVDPARIHVYSYGRDKRVANCNDISCWSQNRRVVTVLQTAVDPMMRQHPRLQPQVQGVPEPQTQVLTQSRAPVYYEPPGAPPADPDPSLEPDTLDTAPQPGQ